jgi:hypothetical protein
MARIEVPNGLHPITVFPAKPLQGGLAIDYAVPVSGSVITRNMIAGTWRVEAIVSGMGGGVSGTFSVPIEVSVNY